MIKNFGDLHKLRLLNFDSGDTRESKSFKGGTIKPSHYYTQNSKKNRKCSTSGLIGNCSKWVQTKSTSETSFKEGSSRRSRISNTFKRQFNQFKRPKTKRSVSLYNLKQHFSSTSFLVTNPINRSLKAVTEKSLKRKQKKHDRCNDTDVHVLFMSETRKAARKIIKPNICDDKRKLDLINNSKTSDCFSFKSNHYHGNKNFQSHKNNNRLFRNFNHHNKNVSKFKQYKENMIDPVRITDRTLNLKSKPYGNTMPMRYNLIDFSCAACEIESQRPYHHCIHKISPIDSSRCFNKQVMVTPFCLNISAESDSFSDNMLTPNNKNKINNPDPKQSCKSCLSKDLKSSQLCSSNLTKNPESLAKLTLKYFLFMIAVIIWSPCILFKCIFWFIPYTTRKVFFLEKTNKSTGNMFRNVGSGRNCCQLILNFLTKISDKMYSFYDTLCSQTKKQKCQKSEPLKPRNNNFFIINNRDMCPNPKNKYKLSYSHHRGWIMKRLKKHRQFINKRCECNIAELPSLRKNIRKKGIRDHYCECPPEELKDKMKSNDQYCECPPEELKDKMKSKTIKSLSRQLSHKFNPQVSKVVSQKPSPESNICGCPPAAISGKDASSMTPPDLVSSKERHREPFRNHSLCGCPEKSVKDLQNSENPVKDLRYPENPVKDLRSPENPVKDLRFPENPVKDLPSPENPVKDLRSHENPVKDLRCPENSVKDLSIKPRKKVSFHGNQADYVDVYGSRKFQVMSPRVDVESPFLQTKLSNENVPINSFNKIVKGKSPCSCQVKLVATHRNSKRPIRIQKQKLICQKYTGTKKSKTANTKPKFVYRKYESKGRRLTKRQKVFCWLQCARKNVNEVVHDVESEVWKCYCNKDMTYIHTLRRKPCFWIYRCYPCFYPYFLIFYRFYENVVIGLMFIISACIWVPILCWCYICFSLFCRCFRC